MTGKIRIIGGQWRGRKLVVPDRPGLRPTGDRARETLFNWIGPAIVGARVLDLFAGTGALGLEAASRGAARVVLVERDGVAIRALREGPALWPGGSVLQLVQADALSWLTRTGESFDLILMDPPFAADLHQGAMTAVLARPALLSERALIYVESSPEGFRAEDWADRLELRRQKRQGDVVLSLLQARASADPAAIIASSCPTE